MPDSAQQVGFTGIYGFTVVASSPSKNWAASAGFFGNQDSAMATQMKGAADGSLLRLVGLNSSHQLET